MSARLRARMVRLVFCAKDRHLLVPVPSRTLNAELSSVVTPSRPASEERECFRFWDVRDVPTYPANVR
jgi:hypothetical protein